MSNIIWVEGPDNCGKTTLVSELKELFGDDCEVVKQPASTSFGKVIHDLHHQYASIKMNMFSRQLLHIASHIEYYEQNKRPTTKTILNDRSFLSTIAYYMAFSGESGLLSKRIDLILDLEMHFLPRALQPNHIIFLLNEPFEESKEELENYSKLSKAYAEVIQYSKELFPNAKKFGHKIAKNGAKESAKELFELLK